MISRIASYIKANHMVQPGDHVCVGVSGGADSVCLFLVLEELRHSFGFSVSVVHIEHGIRGQESVEDMEFVRTLAGQYGIPFTGKAFEVGQLAREWGCSVEEAGRNVRYQVFGEERERFKGQAKKRGGTVKTAVAHHGDDNAETIMFHMCRGSGIEGMAGMHPVRGEIIRPLLCVSRREIEAFLEKKGQVYRTDATNADTSYSRNRIRNCIMPELMQVNGECVGHMNQLASDLLEVSSYLKWQVEAIVNENTQRLADGSVGFRTNGLLGLPPFLQKRVMIELIAQAAGNRKDITREHANALLAAAQGQTGKRVSLPYGLTAETSYGMLLFSAQARKAGQKTAGEALVEGINGKIRFLEGVFLYRMFEISEKDVKIPKNLYTKWFDYDKIKNRLYLRTRKPGDYFTLDKEGHKQKLKDYLMNEKVPKYEREKIPLLSEGAHILWAVGYRISAYYKITEHTKRVLEVQFMEEKA